MAANFEPVAVALLAVVDTLDTVQHTTRYKLGLEQLPDVPTCVVAMSGASVQSQHGLPSRWTGRYEVGYIAHSHHDRLGSPETFINAWLVEFQGAMASDVTLGGKCEHAWISGEVEVIPPTLDMPIMECWVSVEVLVLAT